MPGEFACAAGRMPISRPHNTPPPPKENTLKKGMDCVWKKLHTDTDNTPQHRKKDEAGEAGAADTEMASNE